MTASDGPEFSISVLVNIARALIIEADETAAYRSSILVEGKQIIEEITYRWTNIFVAANRIVLWQQNGKLLVSSVKELFIDKSVTYDLGPSERGL